jgi:hypothetical protein
MLPCTQMVLAASLQIFTVQLPESFSTTLQTDSRTCSRVDTKWRFQFFAKYDYRFLLDVIIEIITTFFAKAIIAISRLSLSISLE